MNKSYLKAFLMVLPSALCFSQISFAQNGNCNSINSIPGIGGAFSGDCYNTITTGVPFLRIAPDSRGGSMGDAGVATSPDANDNHYNIAKMARNTKQSGLSLTYTPWLRDLVADINLAYLAGYYKFGQNQNQAVSGSLRYFNLGDIDFTDFNAQPIGTGKPREFAVDLGYSRQLGKYSSIGIAGRYIHSNLANGPAASASNSYKPGNAGAIDFGYYFTKPIKADVGTNPSNLSFGAAITNLGTKISYNDLDKDFIPTNLALGAAYKYRIDEFNSITGTFEINKLLVPTPQFERDTLPNGQFTIKQIYDKKINVIEGVFQSFGDAPGKGKEEFQETNFNIGAEYAYQNQFFVRAGYFYEDPYKGNRKFLTTGVGFKYNVFNLNLSYVVPSGQNINRNPLSNTLRFTMLFDLDKMKTTKKAVKEDEDTE
jgi:Type IX secretion system protein PorV